MLQFNGDGDCNTMRGEIASLPSFPVSTFGRLSEFGGKNYVM
jgi:hypothetical protein